MKSTQETFALVRKLAKEKGVTINKMLLDCGLGKSLISDSERKNSFPTADKLATIAAYLNVSTDYLIRGVEYEPHLKLIKNEKENEGMNKRYIEEETVKNGLRVFFENNYLNEKYILHGEMNNTCFKKINCLSTKTGIEKERIEQFLRFIYREVDGISEAYYPTYDEFDKMMFIDKCTEPDAVKLLERLEKEEKILERDRKANENNQSPSKNEISAAR